MMKLKALLLPMLFLIFSCDTPEEPDCAGISGGDAVEDCSGVCGGTMVDVNIDGFCDEWVDLTVTDVDGNSYETVQIGYQLWMAENLKVPHYNDGSDIQYVQSELFEPDVWGNLITGAYGYNDWYNLSYLLDSFGKLYNWPVVGDDRGVCPEGFHVPSDEEFTILTDYLIGQYGGEIAIDGVHGAGGEMKECTEGSCPESNYWISPNTGATNESGFTGLPSGFRSYSSGNYHDLGSYGYFWSFSEYNSDNAWGRDLGFNNPGVYRSYYDKQYGFSIRCLGD